MDTPFPGGDTPFASFDSVVLAAVIAECQDLVGASVQRVLQAGPDEIVLALRSRGRARALLISAHPRWGRLHLTERAGQASAGTFVQLLRGRLEGSRLRAMEAPPFERLVRLSFETLEGPQDLMVEIMGRHANLLLCQEGIIIGALRQVGLDKARSRAVLPQRPYMRPSEPAVTPASITAEDLLRAPSAARGGRSPTHGEAPAAWRTVLSAVGGIGPALAWEACLRADIDPKRPLVGSDSGAVVDALRAVGRDVLTGAFAPVLYLDRDQPVAYAAFPLRCFAALRSQSRTMSAAVDAVAAQAAGVAATEASRKSMASLVAQAAARVRRALDAVAADARHAEDADRLRQSGELILAYLSQIEPAATRVDVPGFDGQPVSITLDPHRTGIENAQAYFARYARAAAARRRLPQRRTELESELAFLDALSFSVAQAESADDLWEVEQDLIAAGLTRRAKPSRRPRPVEEGRAFNLPGGFRVRVGRSARDNDRLTFDIAGPNDLWLHARGMPGAHTVVTGGSGDPPQDVIMTAAAIAAYYSAGRRAASVPVDVTRRRHVRKSRAGRPGQVFYTHERTLTVAPGLPPAPR